MTLRVKDILREKSVTMEEVAARLGINRVSLSRNINGNPTIETLQKLANVLEVDLRDLFAPSAGTEPMDPIEVLKDIRAMTEKAILSNQNHNSEKS